MRLSVAQEAAAGAASASDRAWFEQHPLRSHRIRPSIEGEFGSIEFDVPGAVWAVTRQVQPGFRLRLPFSTPFGPPPDVEEIGHALFDLIRESMRTGTPGVWAETVAKRASMRQVRGTA